MRRRTARFAGDRILVKHTEQYVEENPDRVPEGAPTVSHRDRTAAA